MREKIDVTDFRKSMILVLLPITVLPLLLCVACTKPGGISTPSDPAITPLASQGGVVDLNTVFQNPDYLNKITSSGWPLRSLGADYLTELPNHNVEVEGTTAVFSPQWTQENNTLEDLGIAIYGFNLTGESPANAVNLQWNQFGSQLDCWIGVSDFSHQSWTWFSPNELQDGLTSFSVDFDDRGNPETGALYIAVVLTGTDTWGLSELWLGDGIAPNISEVTPLSAEYLTTATFIAEVTGSELLSFNWDFAGASDPPTSTEESPQVLLTTVGEHSATLEVQNAYGDAIFPFNLSVYGVAPTVNSVTPMYAENNTAATFSAAVFGSPTITYAWDFGGGATPDTSTDNEPNVVIGDTGEYIAQLIVTNEFGTDAFPFTLTVYEDGSEWVHTWGTANSEGSRSVYIDNDGRIITTSGGTIWGIEQVDFAITCVFNQAGYPIWQRGWSGPETDYGTSVVADSLGNIYVTGYTHSFPEGDQEAQIFVLKYSPDGELLWQRVFVEDVNMNFSNDSILHPDGGIIVCGYQAMNTPDRQPYGIIVSLDSDGNLRWGKKWDSQTRDVGVSIISDGTGNFYVAGSTGGAGDNPYPYGPIANTGLLKFSGSGSLLWSRCWGTENHDGWMQLAVDSTGNIFASGSSLDRDSTLDKDILVAKYTSDGTLVWGKVLDIEYGDSSNGFTCSGNNVWMAATSYFEDFAIPFERRLLKLGTNGSLLDTRFWNAGETKVFSDITTDHQGNLILSGTADNNSGTWNSSSAGFASTSTMEKTLLNGMEVSNLDLNLVTPAGEEILIPPGVVDTGGGGNDVLLIKIAGN